MGDNFLISINLMRLKGVAMKKMKDQNGKINQCVVIPVEPNNFFVSARGDVYVGLTAYAAKEGFEHGTHEIKRSLSKEESQGMTTEDRKRLPNIGTMRPINFKAKEEKPKVERKKIDINNMPF